MILPFTRFCPCLQFITPVRYLVMLCGNIVQRKMDLYIHDVSPPLDRNHGSHHFYQSLLGKGLILPAGYHHDFSVLMIKTISGLCPGQKTPDSDLNGSLIIPYLCEFWSLQKKINHWVRVKTFWCFGHIWHIITGIQVNSIQFNSIQFKIINFSMG